MGSSLVTLKRVNPCLGCAITLYAILLMVSLLTPSALAGVTRCFNICQRSEFEMKCRRCRWREPLRFGKRNGDLETDFTVHSKGLPWTNSDEFNQLTTNHQRSSSISSSSSSQLKRNQLLLRYLLTDLFTNQPMTSLIETWSDNNNVNNVDTNDNLNVDKSDKSDNRQLIHD